MDTIVIYLTVIIAVVLLIPFVGVKWKGIVNILAVIAISVLGSIPAIRALIGIEYSRIFAGSFVTGEIPIKIDALSGWFILLINFTFITGAIYGHSYMKAYHTQSTNISIHWICYILVHSSLIAICCLQNSIGFLIAWEIMAISTFILVIFEHQKNETIKAGINYLIQSHICILFLTLAFLWVGIKTGSYDFNNITTFTQNNTTAIGLSLFFVFFMGFAIKAGFVPFHTWLPYAHPAAPTHVSGVMSGVIIKIGIYGILRMIYLIRGDYITIGNIILFISVISALYGVILAILQHNFKKLLAYHSIENIGIIGIGIGIGCIGIGKENITLITLGFAGALLHTLNHSLFKSLLFFGAGNVYQTTHSLNIEQLGGLIKRMPHTALLFLTGALAICGLPPFNGFISEFLIYNGLIKGLVSSNMLFLLTISFSLFSLALVGGLAMLCFTKAFGTVFLGLPRHEFKEIPKEANLGKLVPMYAIAIVILMIGIFPKLFFHFLSTPLKLFAINNSLQKSTITVPFADTLFIIGCCSVGFILLSLFVFFVRKKLALVAFSRQGQTWGCGYVAPDNKMQYTASSFVRTYRKLFEPILLIFKFKQEVKGIFPNEGWHETHTLDKIEIWLINNPLRYIKSFLNLFSFLQNGKIQFYIIYGVVFISMVLLVPVLYEKIIILLNFINHL